jgi:hypothetical protein
LNRPQPLSLTVMFGFIALLLLALMSCGRLSDSTVQGDSGASQVIDDTAAQRDPISRPACDHYDPNRNVFWGELHVHTGLSGDAFRSDVGTTPDDAYRFAQGEPIRISPLDSDGNGTQRPL